MRSRLLGQKFSVCDEEKKDSYDQYHVQNNERAKIEAQLTKNLADFDPQTQVVRRRATSSRITQRKCAIATSALPSENHPISWSVGWTPWSKDCLKSEIVQNWVFKNYTRKPFHKNKIKNMLHYTSDGQIWFRKHNIDSCLKNLEWLNKAAGPQIERFRRREEELSRKVRHPK